MAPLRCRAVNGLRCYVNVVLVVALAGAAAFVATVCDVFALFNVVYSGDDLYLPLGVACRFVYTTCT